MLQKMLQFRFRVSALVMDSEDFTKAMGHWQGAEVQRILPIYTFLPMLKRFFVVQAGNVQ